MSHAEEAYFRGKQFMAIMNRIQVFPAQRRGFELWLPVADLRANMPNASGRQQFSNNRAFFLEYFQRRG